MTSYFLNSIKEEGLFPPFKNKEQNYSLGIYEIYKMCVCHICVIPHSFTL